MLHWRHKSHCFEGYYLPSNCKCVCKVTGQLLVFIGSLADSSLIKSNHHHHCNLCSSFIIITTTHNHHHPHHQHHKYGRASCAFSITISLFIITIIIITTTPLTIIISITSMGEHPLLSQCAGIFAPSASGYWTRPKFLSSFCLNKFLQILFSLLSQKILRFFLSQSSF